MKLLLNSCLILCLLSLVACTSTKQSYQSFKNKPNVYMNSQAEAPLRIPPGIEHEPLLEDDRVPPGEVAKEKAPLLPPESLVQQVAEGKVSKKELKHVSSRNLEEKDRQWVMTLTDDKEHVWSRLEKAFKYRKIRVLQTNKQGDVFYIVDTFTTHGKITLKSPIYQVHLRSTPEQNTEIYITDNAGHPPNAHTAHRLLVDIDRGIQGQKVHELPKILKKWLPSSKK